MTKAFWLFGGIATSAVFAQPVTHILTQDHHLEAGEAIYSPNGVYRAQLQSDGNFVLSLVSPNRGEPARPLYSTRTAGAVRLEMQRDCNLVLYDRAGRAVWNTGTAGREEFCDLRLFDDGTLELRSAVDPRVSHPTWDDGFLKHSLWKPEADGKIGWQNTFTGTDDNGAACTVEIGGRTFSIGGYTYELNSTYLGGYEGSPLTISAWVSYAGHHRYTLRGSRWYSDLLWSNLDVEARLTLGADGVATEYSLAYFPQNQYPPHATTLHCRGLQFH